METILPYVLYGLAGLFGLIVLIGSFFTVEQQTTAVVERFGKFARLAQPGLNLKIPLIERIADRVNLRIEQLDVEVETKTADNVFVEVKVSVQHFVLPGKVYDAYYKLDKPDAQIESYVFDVVRARVPKLKLDELFEKKDEIADAVKHELEETMDDFGYGITKALVTDIDPDEEVKKSMNAINAAQRHRMAAEEQGEAERILKVKSAEADAQSKKLQGQGIADQRKAIVDGLKDSLELFKESIPGATPMDVMQLILLTQYFDTLKDLGASSQTNTILLPHSPGGLADVSEQIRNATITAGQVPGAAPRGNGPLPRATAPSAPPRPAGAKTTG
jgi:regulator of protease activity HflC (stomatin/prohibitin superfamily)